MKSVARLFLILFLSMPLVAPVFAGEDFFGKLAQQEKEFRDSIMTKQVLIIVQRTIRGDLPKRVVGTGVIIGKQEKDDKVFFNITTAAHLFGTDEEFFKNADIRVFFSTAQALANLSQAFYPAKIITFNWQLEYVLLSVEIPKAEAINLRTEIAPIAQEPPKILETFWMSGYYSGAYPVVNKAYLSRVIFNYKGFSDNGPFQVFLDFAFIASGVNGPGMSGGGAFNYKGEYVALLWAVEDDGRIVHGIPAVFIFEDIRVKFEAFKKKESENQKK